MTSGTNAQRTIAILATDGVERVELTEPRRALEDAGVRTEIVSPGEGWLQAWDRDEKSERVKIDRRLGDASPEEYDGLLLPGGVQNPDFLRQNPAAVNFVRAFFDEDKPVAAICHGPWLLVEADVVRGKHVTSWPSLKTDLRNAGATWSDEKVVEDGKLVTSRKPDDIPAFTERAIAAFKAG
jgi:protease I